MTKPTFDPETGMWWGEEIKPPDPPARALYPIGDPSPQAGWPTAEQLGLDARDFYMPAVERSRQLTRDREQYARRLLEQRLPRPLHWIIDRPRALKLAFRLRLLRRPSMSIITLASTMTAEAARHMGRRWLASMQAKGNKVPDGGLIFTYTDVEGLPAEVHGV
jgi:hypothetical protein